MVKKTKLDRWAIGMEDAARIVDGEVNKKTLELNRLGRSYEVYDALSDHVQLLVGVAQKIRSAKNYNEKPKRAR